MEALFVAMPAEQVELAFEALIEAQLDSMYSVALRYTRDPSPAEDLVHDTVVRALRFRDKFQPGSNFRAWIFTILTNTFIHRYRRQKREREILEGVSREDVEGLMRSQNTHDEARAPERTYLERMLSDDVVHALNSLPEDFRTVVVLCDLQGMSYKEISDLLACPVGTVMSRLYRARRSLEAALQALAVERGILRPTANLSLAPVAEPEVDIGPMRRRRTG